MRYALALVALCALSDLGSGVVLAAPCRPQSIVERVLWGRQQRTRKPNLIEAIRKFQQLTYDPDSPESIAAAVDRQQDILAPYSLTPQRKSTVADGFGNRYLVIRRESGDITITDEWGVQVHLARNTWRALKNKLTNDSMQPQTFTRAERAKLLADQITHGWIARKFIKSYLYPILWPVTGAQALAKTVNNRGLLRIYEWPLHWARQDSWSISANLMYILTTGSSGPLWLLTSWNDHRRQVSTVLGDETKKLSQDKPALFINLHDPRSGFFDKADEHVRSLKPAGASIDVIQATSLAELQDKLRELQARIDSGSPRYGTLYIYTHGNVGVLKVGGHDRITRDTLSGPGLDLLEPGATILGLACLAGCDGTTEELAETTQFHEALGRYFSKHEVLVLAARQELTDAIWVSEYDTPPVPEVPAPAVGLRTKWFGNFGNHIDALMQQMQNLVTPMIRETKVQPK